jgi:hypothetical protein
MRTGLPLIALVIQLCASELVAAQEAVLRVDPYTMLAQPMSSGDLVAVATILTLSEWQVAAAGALFDEYAAHLRALAPHIQQINRLEGSRRMTGTVVRGELVPNATLSPHEQLALSSEVLKESERIEAILNRHEDAFFDALVAILADSQLVRLPAAKRARYRTRYQVRTTSLPGAQVDIVALFHRLGVERDGIEGVSELLAAYEERLVELLQARHASQRRTHLRGLEWEARVSGMPIDAAALAERSRIRARQIRLESSIRRLNMSTLEALSIMLRQSDVVRLHDEFHSIAHPPWSPDQESEHVRRVLEEALLTAGVDEDIADSLAYLHESFQANWQRLQRRLSDADFKFRERFDQTLSAHVDELDAHDAEIDAILKERRALCERTTRAVSELMRAAATE